jgi:hypothetical protein
MPAIAARICPMLFGLKLRSCRASSPTVCPRNGIYLRAAPLYTLGICFLLTKPARLGLPAYFDGARM